MAARHSELKQFILDRQDYGLDEQSQEDMEVFHERTKFHPAGNLNRSIKVGNYMTFRYCVQQMVNNFKSYPLSKKIELPEPDLNSISMPFNEILANRRSVRAYKYKPITVHLLSNMLKAAAGITRTASLDQYPDLTLASRTYPSAGNLFPVEVYPILLGVDGIPRCVTHYDAHNHRLDVIRNDFETEDLINALADFDISGPGYTKDLNMVIVLTAVFQRCVIKYEERGYRFSLIEAGLVGYNFSLAAIGLGLGSLNWGAYYDGLMDDLLKVDGASETTVNCILIGNPADE